MRTSNIHERIIGFDARVMGDNWRSSWGNARIEDALLRKDIVRPLSVDDAVWPSIFDDVESFDRESKSFTVPNWKGPNTPLWNDLNLLEHVCQEITVQHSYWIAAFTVYVNQVVVNYLNSKGPQHSLLTVEATSPPQVSANWPFIGFDVADAGRLSGLSNCFYTGPNDGILFEPFREVVNSYHLFEDINRALEFAMISDRRAPEHSPFFVYGLYRVAEHSSS